MRVAVCGGRDYRDEARVFEALDIVHALTGIEELIHGATNGADALAGKWAARRGVPISAYPADWNNITVPGARIRYRRGKPYDASAGFRRNIRMLLEGAPELVIAFPGGNETAHMVTQSLRRGFAVLSVDA